MSGTALGTTNVWIACRTVDATSATPAHPITIRAAIIVRRVVNPLEEAVSPDRCARAARELPSRLPTPRGTEHISDDRCPTRQPHAATPGSPTPTPQPPRSPPRNTQDTSVFMS